VGELGAARPPTLAVALGGAGPNSELYDPIANTFSMLAMMNQGRKNAVANLLLNGNVLIAGGLDVNGNPLPTTELYTL
jgi:hypothetical protein